MTKEEAEAEAEAEAEEERRQHPHDVLELDIDRATDESQVSIEIDAEAETNSANVATKPSAFGLGGLFANPSRYMALCEHFPYYSVITTIVYVVVCAVWYPNVSELPQLVLDTEKKAQVWRIYTYSLLHADVLHIVSNLVMLLALGMPMEMIHNSLRYFVLHTLGAVQGVGGIGWEKRLAGDWDSRTVAVGASGIAYCMIGVHVPDMILNWREMHPGFRWFRLSVISGLICAEILLWYYFYQERISYGGHFGGLIGGVLGGFPLVRNIAEPQWQRWTKYVMSVLYVAYTVAGVINYFVV